MKIWKALFLGAALAAAVASCSRSDTFGDVADTHENRVAAARRHMEVVSMEDLLDNMVEEVARNLPEQSRKEFADIVQESVDIRELEEVSVRAMADHFTVREINAMTGFYGSPEGRSIMKKYGAYMSDVMPAVQGQMVSALFKIQGRMATNRQ